MYCRTCGQANADYSIYCSNDGTLLHSNKKNTSLTRSNVSFCKDCGETIKSYDLYCTNCGISLFEEKRRKTLFQGPVKNIPKTINMEGKKNIKSPIFYSLIGFGIIFLISLIVSGIINSAIQKELSYDLGIATNIKLVNPFDLILLLNLSNLKLTASLGSYGFSTATLGGVPFVFLLIPFSIFFILGIFQGKKDHHNSQQFQFINPLLTGLFYGLIICIISLFHKGKIDIPIPYLGGIVNMTKNYIFLTSLINGSLMSILSLLLGYGAYAKLSKKENIIQNFSWLFDGLFLFLISVVSIVIASTLFIKFGLDEDTGSKVGDFVLFSQSSIYAFLIIHLGSFGFSQDFIDEKISLLKKVNPNHFPFGNKALIFLYLAILLPIVLFFLYGRKSKNIGNKKIIYTTLTYSLIVGILAYLTHINLAGSGSAEVLDEFFNSNISMGVKFLSPFLGSFVLSTLATMAGFLLGKEEVAYNE